VGRQPQVIHKHFHNAYNGTRDVDVELFTWEKLDCVESIRNNFSSFFIGE